MNMPSTMAAGQTLPAPVKSSLAWIAPTATPYFFQRRPAKDRDFAPEVARPAADRPDHASPRLRAVARARDGAPAHHEPRNRLSRLQPRHRDVCESLGGR